MARREHALTIPVTLQDALGASTVYGLVRISSLQFRPLDKIAICMWEIGRMNAGAWEKAGSLEGQKVYQAAAYDTLEALISAAAGEGYISKIEDQIYADLVTDGVVGAGTQQDYST